MKDITREWVEKAEGDYRTAGRELYAEPPNYDATAFHAQQCVEVEPRTAPARRSLLAGV